MANTNKFVVKNGLQSQNVDFVSPNGSNTITLSISDADVLSISGNAGQLFSITDSFSGTIFSANDVSGIPSIEVLDTGLVKLAQYSGNVLLGTGTDNATDKLQVNGSITGSVLKSTAAIGTAPFVVTSTTLVTNLNANFLGGQSSTYYTTAGNLTGTLPSGVLANSSLFIGTTSVALNRASANLALTGISSVTLPGATSGTIVLTPTATAGTTTITLPATTGTVITTGDTGTVTNTMLAGSIAITKLASSSITINSASTSLGGSVTLYVGTTTLQTSSAQQSVTGFSDLSLGRTDNVASTPFIDFNSGATSVDYDVRLQASGGTGAAGNGTLTLSGNLSVTGNLTINGTTTTVNSTTVTIDDPIFTLGGDTAPATDDNKDRGVEFRYHNGTAAKVGFFGFDDSTGYFTFIPDATNTSEVFSGTQGDIQAANFRGNGSNLTDLNASNLSSGTVPGDRGVSAGSASASFVEYNGTTKTAGQFDGGTTAPSNTTRLNYDGYLYATRFYGDGSQLTGISLPSGQTAGSSTSGYLQYAGTTKTDGQLYGGTSSPTNATRLNYDGHFYATKFYGDASGLTNTNFTSTTTQTVINVIPLLQYQLFGGF